MCECHEHGSSGQRRSSRIRIGWNQAAGRSPGRRLRHARGVSSGRVVDEFPPGWVQVWFRLSGGPANALGMGAEVLSPDRVRLPCAPWAALNAAKGDVFQVQRGTDGQLWIQDPSSAVRGHTSMIVLR